MLRIIRYLFLAVVGIVLVVVSLANRGVVTLHVVPGELAPFLPLPNSLELPLFLVILGSVIVGLLIGFVLEYIREYRHRAEAARRKREIGKMERELRGLRDKTGEGKDDVLALLE